MEFMYNYIHHCLMCNEHSYEVEEGVFKCSVCGFEWETIGNG